MKQRVYKTKNGECYIYITAYPKKVKLELDKLRPNAYFLITKDFIMQLHPYLALVSGSIPIRRKPKV